MIVTRADLESSLAALRRQIADPRVGILGPHSIAWRIGGDVAVFLGGGRAALLQLAHPMIAYAIAQHSRARADVAGRFRRTFRHVFAMVFGDLDDAFAAARRVHAIHDRIHGTLPEAAGCWPGGTPYHANDAELLRWVHATLVDTTLVVREQLDGPLPQPLKDSYVIEMNRFAALFGIPGALLPRSHRAHAAYMREMLASDRLAVAPCAREMARFLVGRGGTDQPPLGRIAESVTALMLPAQLAAQFSLCQSPSARAPAARPAAARGGTRDPVGGAPEWSSPRQPLWRARAGLRAFGVIYRRLPSCVRGIPARTEAQRRIDGLPPSRLGAWAERRLFGLARRATGG